MHALVIDDSRAVRVIIGNDPRASSGCDVVEAGNGREALEQLRRNPDVELVLVDWNMPVMNGLEFIQAVRARAAPTTRVRIMMVTTETERSRSPRRSTPGRTST